VDLGAAFVTDEQAAELVSQARLSSCDPAEAARAGAILGSPAGDHRFDPASSELAPVASEVVAAIADEAVGSAARPADGPVHGRYPADERDHLGDIVADAAGQREGERYAAWSTIRWCVEPSRPRSTGLGPRLTPPFSPVLDWNRPRRASLDLSGRAQSLEGRPCSFRDDLRHNGHQHRSQLDNGCQHRSLSIAGPCPDRHRNNNAAEHTPEACT
jgi:hypothetical protein